MRMLSVFLAASALVLASCSSSPSASQGNEKPGGGAPTTTVAVSTLALTANDLPAGWAPAPASSSSSSPDSTPNCLKGYGNLNASGNQNSPSENSVSFEQGSGGPQFTEIVHYTPGQAESLVSRTIQALDGCGTFTTASTGGQAITGTIKPLPDPHLGRKSAAFQMSVSASILSISIPIVIVQVNSDVALLGATIELGSTPPPTHQLLVDAVTKASGKRSPDYGANAPKALGQPASFAGSDVRATVTAVRIVNPAQAANQYDTPNTGNQYVGVEFKIVNTGTSAFQPSSGSNATLIDTSAHSYSSDYSDLAGCPAFASSLTLNPGDTADGCVAFQVPIGTTISKVQYTSQSSGTAEWLAG